jgi:hypothetical protein
VYERLRHWPALLQWADLQLQLRVTPGYA